MITRKIYCSILTVLITSLSVSTMIYLDRRVYTIPWQYTEYDEDIDKYTGYIFEDYNIKVNLGYKDETVKDSEDVSLP